MEAYLGGYEFSRDVFVQDQNTPPVPTYFLRSLSNFTLSSDTGASGIDAGTFVYSFEATVGHGISATNQIILLDVAADRQFFATVISVSTNTITLDRMIDHDFKAATSLGRIVTNEMKVDGSSTPQIYTIRAGEVPTDFTGLNISIVCTAEPTDELFGSVTALTRGLAFRVLDGYQKTIGTMKNNAELRGFGGCVEYTDKAGGTNWAVNVCIPVRDAWGVVLRAKNDDVLQVVVQDNLNVAGIVSVKASMYGHLTQGET